MILKLGLSFKNERYMKPNESISSLKILFSKFVDKLNSLGVGLKYLILDGECSLNTMLRSIFFDHYFFI